MLFDYFDALSGEAVYLSGVGHIRSPLVKELYPHSGLSNRGYKFFLSVLLWDKEDFLRYGTMMELRGVDKLSNPKLSAFDVATLLPQTREFCREILSFFMLECLAWDESARAYVAISDDEDHSEIGRITRDNFDAVREAMLQMNYVGVDKDKSPVSHSDDKSKELWERAQQHLAEQAKKETEDKPAYHLSNIISKICAVHPSYNILNIGDLTVFQLYDAFFQIGYMRSADLSARIFSNHGGDKFHFEDWLNPIIKNV